jgi:nucleoside 2-deoxyribosyltransferase
MKIYLAGPLFSLAEKEFNKRIADELERKNPNCKVYLPQEFSKK